MDYKQEIEIIAFDLYQRDGCIQGRELEHWFTAEGIFHSRNKAAAAVTPSASKKTAAAGTAKKKVALKKSKVAESKPANKISAKAKARKSSSSQKDAAL